MTVGEVPEGVAFRLIRCARNYELSWKNLARTFRAGKIDDFYGIRQCTTAADRTIPLFLDRPVVLVETIGRRGGYGPV